MKKNTLFRKGLACAILVLFVSISTMPFAVSLSVEHVSTNVEKSCMPVNTSGNTLYVGGSGPGNYSEIQDAIDNANDGDTVFVFDDSSPYHEYIVVNKSINLIGEDKSTTVIDWEKRKDVVSIVVDWVNISGFTIKGNEEQYDWVGIRIFSNHTIVMDNIISNNPCGIDLSESGSNNIVTGNNISNNLIGICLSSSGNNITDNTINTNKWYGIGLYESSCNNIITGNNIISNNEDGIAISESCNNNIVAGNNISSNSGDGIHLYYSSGNNIIGNNISSNSGDGIYLYDSSSSIITDNTMVGDGILIEGYTLEYWDTHVIDTSNTVNGKPVIYWKNQIGGKIPTGAGQIILANCTNVVVENQNISGSNVGMEFGFSSSCTIIGNNITNNGDGINLYYSSSNNIIGNNITNNGLGILLHESSGNNIIGNNISNNGGGIYLYDYSSNNIITGNNMISNNWDGIWLYESSSNIITDNVISNIGGGGYLYKSSIYLDHSSCNTITGNTIVGDGILIIHGYMLEYWNTHVIDTSNTVNGKPVIYWKNQIGGTISTGAGQVILANCTNVVVENQNISGDGVGMEIGFSSGCTITGSTISNNEIGIYLYESGSNNIIGSTISNNSWGILFEYSSDNNIIGNNVSNNNRGIEVGGSSNSIIGNTISGNNNWGIYVGGSSNIFYHNKFIYNTYNAYATGKHIWDDGYPSGGNFWDDYQGIDGDGDGIGDELYTINGDNDDRFPLGNFPPDAPIITGQTRGKVGVEYEYNISISDPNGDSMYLRVNWGNGTSGLWQGPYDSDTIVKLNHTWDQKGTFVIRAEIKDIYDRNGFSGKLTVKIPKDKIVNFMSLILKLVEKFPFFERILLMLQV